MQRYRVVLAATVAGALTLFATQATRVAAPAAAPGPTQAIRVGAPAAAPRPTLAAVAVRARPAAEPSAAADLTPLLAMTADLATTGHDTTMTTQDSTTESSLDPAHHAASAVAKGNGAEIDEVVANGQIYIRADLGTELDTESGITPNVWMSVDPGQVSADNELLIQPDGSDPVDIAGIMTGITTLKSTDPAHLTGTIDLTKVTGYTLPDPDEVSKAGAPATAVPFTVDADSSGRISTLDVNANAFDPTLSLLVAYTDYGSPAPISVPTSTLPAPTGLYSLFNN